MYWNEKNLDSVVEFINIELDKGRSLADIERNEFGVNPSTIAKRLSRRNYKRIDNKFIKLDVRQPVRHDVISIEKVDVLGNNNKMMTIDDVVTERKNQEKLISLINKYDDLMELLNSKTINNFNSGIVIELPNEEGKKDTRATIRVNKVIWRQFNEFCEKNKAFSKKELLSQALKEFIDRY